LEGLARLRYPRESFEVLIVNDGESLPPASALDAVASSLRYRVLPHRHAGPARARNAGAAAAEGTFLAFIDDDCVADREWLHCLGSRLEAEPKALVGGRTVNALAERPFSDASQLLVDFLASYHDASDSGRTRFFATSNLAVAADEFRRSRGFDGQFAHAAAEDRDFCDRWHGRGGPSIYEPKAVVYHRHMLDLRTFLAQHFRYGRGALRFHRAKQARDAAPPRTPVRFYVDLVLYPLTQRRLPAAATRSVLLAAAQVATASGYCWERLRGAPTNATPRRSPPAD
jgi:cellulose synthase/poly-beta-1,6-N-acetylglucosamine synthase-like glycosyltransferase